jgi:hypothetical protein
VSPVRCDLGLYIQKDGILHSHRCENLKSYMEIDPVSETSYSSECWTMGETETPVKAECHYTWSEPFGIVQSRLPVTPLATSPPRHSKELPLNVH